jgi:hypothetical protein
VIESEKAAFQNLIYLQRIGKNKGPKKPVISSIPVVRAELHISAIYPNFCSPQKSCDIPEEGSDTPILGTVVEGDPKP